VGNLTSEKPSRQARDMGKSTYACPTCGKDEMKWCQLQAHWQSTGHGAMSLRQVKAFAAGTAAAETPATPAARRGVKELEDLLVALIQDYGGEVTIEKLNADLMSSKSLGKDLLVQVRSKATQMEATCSGIGKKGTVRKEFFTSRPVSFHCRKQGHEVYVCLIVKSESDDDFETPALIGNYVRQSKGEACLHDDAYVMIEDTQSSAAASTDIPGAGTSKPIAVPSMVENLRTACRRVQAADPEEGAAGTMARADHRKEDEGGDTAVTSSAEVISLSSALNCVIPPLPEKKITLPGGHVVFVHPPVSTGVAMREAARQIQAAVALGHWIAVDCEGVNLSATGELCLLQVAFVAGHGLECYLVDTLSLKHDQEALDLLRAILEDAEIVKLIHDARMDYAALKHQFGITMQGVLDTQLAHEEIAGTMLGSMSQFLALCCVPAHSQKVSIHRLMDQDPCIWKRRPLAHGLDSYAVKDVALLLLASVRLKEMLSKPILEMILRASRTRLDVPPLQAEARYVAFDHRHSFRIASRELLREHIGEMELKSQAEMLQVQDEARSLLALVPSPYRERLSELDLSCLRDIVLDVGARPRAFFGPRQPVFLSDNSATVITEADMEEILRPLNGKFGPDNRAGMNGSLHRISAMRSKMGQVYGLTLRVGRTVKGNASLMTDVLLGSENLSVLLVGNPGAGKTTIVREAARLLSEAGHSVVIVDTSNEICGDGLTVHPSVGLSRRMMVPALERQADVLIEAVQNHTPDVIVVDEIGREQEVEAARTVKNRGVRLIGSAHGNLPGLVKNGMLNGLVGGVQTVTVGDAEARKAHRVGGELSKVRSQRCGHPVFDVVVELRPGCFNKWRVVTDVARAVDCVLAGQPYPCQVRERDPCTGCLTLTLTKSDGSW